MAKLAPSATRSPALEVASLGKTFGGATVLRDVSMTIEPGEVHALLGQNGSGKSTLIKCLAGVHRPDAGSEIFVGGQAVPHGYAPGEAPKYGLAFVHQDLGLIEQMTVAENLALGHGFECHGLLVNWRAQRAHAQRVLDSFGLAVRPTTLVRDLPVTARTLVAIARAFQPRRGEGGIEPACLILDEPTAALPDNDAELLFAAIERVTSTGVGVGYVTHRLDEVFRLASRATILRDGVRIATVDVADQTRESLFDLIVERRSVTQGEYRRESARSTMGPAVLEVRELSGVRVAGASLSIRSGEIVGVAGLAGSGRSELARLLFGSQPAVSGSRWVDGREIVGTSPHAAMDAGIALVPENRRRDGCVLVMDVAKNVTLAGLKRNRLGLLDLRGERRAAQEAITRFDIRPRDPSRAVSTLSGGNQQKVVLAKWLARNPRVIILDEPVQGVDVGAKSDIFTVLRQAASGGAAVLVIDSDFDNLARLCDRVVVMRDGRLVEELHGERLTTENMSRTTFGIDDNSHLVNAAAAAAAAHAEEQP